MAVQRAVEEVDQDEVVLACSIALLLPFPLTMAQAFVADRPAELVGRLIVRIVAWIVFELATARGAANIVVQHG